MKDATSTRKTPEFVNTAKKAAELIEKAYNLDKVFSYSKEGTAVEIIGYTTTGEIMAFNGLFSGNTLKVQFITKYQPVEALRVSVNLDGNDR